MTDIVQNLVHGDQKKADQLLVGFIIVLRFSIDNIISHCWHPGGPLILPTLP